MPTGQVPGDSLGFADERAPFALLLVACHLARAMMTAKCQRLCHQATGIITVTGRCMCVVCTVGLTGTYPRAPGSVGNDGPAKRLFRPGGCSRLDNCGCQ